eukprot:Transcript_18502.p1 GENE.Transcript_18502~~Transcript_18502.p1  ORF type:complete len:486 (-),score=7.87 Transcript_18502:355-1812(-)
MSAGAVIVVPEVWRTGTPSLLAYHDRPGSVARVRFVGPTLQAISVHLDAACTPPCETKVELSLAMSGRYLVEATRLYELSANETTLCTPREVSGCYVSCNPQGEEHGFKELIAECQMNHSSQYATCGRPVKNYFSCMRGCNDQCNFPRLLAVPLQTLSPRGETSNAVKVMGADFLGPNTSLPCSSESALGPGVWTHLSVCDRWEALHFSSHTHCDVALRGEPAEQRLFPELFNTHNTTDDMPTGRYVWRPFSCRLCNTQKRRYSLVQFLGISTTYELFQEFTKVYPGGISMAFPRVSSSVHAHLAQLTASSFKIPNASMLLFLANCGVLNPALTITRSSGPSGDEERSCHRAASTIASYQARFHHTNRHLDVLFQATPTGMPYHYNAEANMRKQAELRYKYHGDRGWIGVDHKVEGANKFILGALAAAGCRVSVFDQHAMAQPMWDLQGDGLHWVQWMPDASKFFVTNVMRVLLHYVSYSQPGRW